VVTDISAAGQEQSQGIEEVNNAITQMDETTQQNAALVEQAAAAAQSMQEQAARLSEAVRSSDSVVAAWPGYRSLRAWPLLPLLPCRPRAACCCADPARPVRYGFAAADSSPEQSPDCSGPVP
jgi:hypothetical protein